MPQPKLSDLKKFCDNDRWDPRRQTDHWRYTKLLANGRTLLTKISFGSGGLGSHDLFAAILRDQLLVTKEEFWRVVRDGGTAQRTLPAPTVTGAAPMLDAVTVMQLRKFGVTEQDVRALKSQDEADALLQQLRGSRLPMRPRQ